MSFASEIRQKRGTKRAQREAIKSHYACENCGVYKSTEAIPRYAEELGKDLLDPGSWLPVCQICSGELLYERQQMRKAGIVLTPVGEGEGR